MIFLHKMRAHFVASPRASKNSRPALDRGGEVAEVNSPELMTDGYGLRTRWGGTCHSGEGGMVWHGFLHLQKKKDENELRERESVKIERVRRGRVCKVSREGWRVYVSVGPTG